KPGSICEPCKTTDSKQRIFSNIHVSPMQLNSAEFSCLIAGVIHGINADKTKQNPDNMFNLLG
ncbi:MAG: hypothetical protein M0T70_02180, partial [Geobacteraceae bacterium]|nr:hypothetical protein [Geobacteraceae bacterium]